MRYSKATLLAITFITSMLVADYHTSAYTNIDDYDILFSTGSAEGTFSGLSGVVDFESDDLASSVINVSVEVESIKTGNTKKDDHAIGKKWFDAKRYPTMMYKATTIAREGNEYVAQGRLTIKDVTLDQQIRFGYDNDDSSYLTGSFNINRKDFNINGNLFGFAVGKDVQVNLRIPAQYQK